MHHNVCYVSFHKKISHKQLQFKFNALKTAKLFQTILRGSKIILNEYYKIADIILYHMTRKGRTYYTTY